MFPCCGGGGLDPLASKTQPEKPRCRVHEVVGGAQCTGPSVVLALLGHGRPVLVGTGGHVVHLHGPRSGLMTGGTKLDAHHTTRPPRTTKYACAHVRGDPFGQ